MKNRRTVGNRWLRILYDKLRFIELILMRKLDSNHRTVLSKLKKLEAKMASQEENDQALGEALTQITTDLQTLADEMDKAFKRLEKLIESGASKVALEDDLAKLQDLRASLQATIDVAKAKSPDAPEEPPTDPNA